MCYVRIVRAMFSIDGCSLWKSVMYVLLLHFSRRVLYRWLYNVQFVETHNVMSNILRSFSRTVNARWQQTTTAHSESRLTRGSQ